MKALLFVALLTSGAAAPVPDTAFQLYAEGKYDEAISAGLARGDGEGLADATRAALAEEASRDEPCLPCLEKAESYARRTMAADPKRPDGYVYLAVTLGLEEHIRGPFEAQRRGYADEARRAIGTALAYHPRDAWALAALGGWNIAIVHGGGALLANWLYGATLKNGLDAFEAAVAEDPNNAAVRYQYALTLSMFDVKRFRSRIEEALTAVAQNAPETAYQRLLQKRAGELLDLLNKGEADAYMARVKKYEGYPPSS